MCIRDRIKEIVKIQVGELAARLADRRITLTLTDSALLQVATTGFDPVYGARPLKRALQKEVMNPLSAAILSGQVREGQSVEIDFAHGKFEIKTEPVVTS